MTPRTKKDVIEIPQSLAGQFLYIKDLADRSLETILRNKSVLKSFADYLDVPPDGIIQEHLTDRNLKGYTSP